MAKLYTTSPNGDWFEHEIKCSSFTVGGTSADWNRHYMVLHNGFLIYEKNYANADIEYALPFPVWGLSMVVTRLAYESGANAPKQDYMLYIQERASIYFTIKTNEPKPSDDNRKYNLILVGEIRQSG